MKYNVEYSKNAEKQIEKLPKLAKKRIFAVVERVRIRPTRFFEKLVGTDSYKLRVGDYRIIADIHNDILCILIVKIKHRKNVYK